MTFAEWWRANESRLAETYYRGGQWVNIHALLHEAFEAGSKE